MDDVSEAQHLSLDASTVIHQLGLMLWQQLGASMFRGVEEAKVDVE
jgi:hypothetical protein